ncbi:MAG: hypothetical protein CMH78_05350 [Nitrospinae bacterium]|nr:hypothetical protein [Nitrospinota bacterium]
MCLSIIWSFSLLMPERVLAADAKTNLHWYCAQCHGENGKGDGVNSSMDLPIWPLLRDFYGRKLANAEDMLNKDNEDRIFNIITKGGPANNLSPLMPPFGNSLAEDERRALAKLINCARFSKVLPRKAKIQTISLLFSCAQFLF